MLLAELATEASLSPKVLNIMHRTHKVVEDSYDYPDIRAISFVGSNVAGMHNYF
jgi:malonate-semialdehyde dehydrogenase (acetylating)/methylmalonate-semialdehyde dehydrogenase